MSEFMSLFWTQFWQVTALILCASVIGATVLRHRPHLMHVLWVVVLIKSLTLPLWSSPTSVFSWVEPHQSIGLIDSGYLIPAPSPHPASLPITISEQSAKAGVASTDSFLSWNLLLALAVGVWAVGALVLLGLAMRRWFEVYRLVKRNSRAADDELECYAREVAKQLKMTCRVRVLISEANLGPMVFGSYRPILILPEAMTQAKSPRELRPIVAHELLHAKRGDTTFGIIQFAAQVVWWFHPLVWWANRQANRVCERCCDEEVIATLGCKPREYARCLLDALELRSHLSPVPALPGIRSIEVTSSRVKNIMKNADSFRPSSPRRYWIYAVILALLLLPGAGLVSAWQDPPVSEDVIEVQAQKQQAERAAANREWALAADKFRAVTERDDSDGRAWFMLGYCLHAAGDLDKAIVAHQRAATFPQVKATAFYNLACAHALMSDRDAAIDALQQAVDAGFRSPRPIEQDSDFATLASDEAFQELAEAARPLIDREVYRQFDFWVGTWSVFTLDGDKIGTNVITKDEKGFLLTEKWTDHRGDTGTSINYYDPSDQHWKRTWVDARGNVVQYEGGFADGKMLLEGRIREPHGSVTTSRVSYSLDQDGSVRQCIQHSDDEGQTWHVIFEGKYLRLDNELDNELVDEHADELAGEHADRLPSGAS